jgi:glutathione S-transferase
VAYPQLTLYGRIDCGLCEVVTAELLLLRQQHPFELEWIDIDRDPQHVARYGQLVPVIVGDNGQQLCHYHLDREAVVAWLMAHAATRH